MTPVAGVHRILTTRTGGVSAAPFDSFNLGGGVGDDPDAVAANRSRLAGAAGLPSDRVVWMHQVHGTRVQRVNGPADASGTGVAGTGLAGTDGMVTSRSDLGLAVLVADCVPLLAADPLAAVIGAAHAGRVGAAAGIDVTLLDVMTSAGADIGRIEVLLGPAICGRCYEVPADMQAEVESALPGSACRSDRGTPALDLRAGLRRRLEQAGVAAVAVDARCTREDPELFSHRRSGTTGRQAAVIWLH